MNINDLYEIIDSEADCTVMPKNETLHTFYEGYLSAMCRVLTLIEHTDEYKALNNDTEQTDKA